MGINVEMLSEGIPKPNKEALVERWKIFIKACDL
jgi:hypothetical protein